jgi:nucleotide-binding universal stress UspA family protein
MYSKILVPVDGSPASNLALLEAIKLAKSTGSKLRLVHVVDEFVMTPGGLGAETYFHEVVESLRTLGKKVLERARSTVHEHALEPDAVLIETIGHRVAGQVTQLAKDWPADLIVMGTHGRRGIARLVMGSDAELVLRTSPVPVLLVKGPTEST